MLTFQNLCKKFNMKMNFRINDFKILPVGVAEAGAWKYSFIYEIVSRHFPGLPERARTIGEREARTKLIELYIESVGAAQEGDVHKLFGWKKDLTTRAITGLVEKRMVVESEYPKQKGKWLALPKLAKEGRPINVANDVCLTGRVAPFYKEKSCLKSRS